VSAPWAESASCLEVPGVSAIRNDGFHHGYLTMENWDSTGKKGDHQGI